MVPFKIPSTRRDTFERTCQIHFGKMLLGTRFSSEVNGSFWLGFFEISIFLVSWLVGWILWRINLCRLLNAKSIFIQIVLFQTIQFSMSTQFNCQKHFYFKLFSFISVYSNSSNSAKSVYYKHGFCLHTVKCQNSSISNNSV